MSRAKGFTSLPPYQWVKNVLIASVGVMGSDTQQRLQSTLGLAILLYVGEQVSESLLHFMGFQRPPHVVQGCTMLLRFGAKVIPRGYAHLRAMLQQLRYYCAKNVAWQDSATPSFRLLHREYNQPNASTSFASDLGGVLWKLDFSSLGPHLEVGFVKTAADYGTGPIPNTLGWGSLVENTSRFGLPSYEALWPRF